MFGVSFFELLVIMTVVLIFLGPDKLPEAAKKMGRFMGFLKRNSDALRREFYNAVYAPAEDMKKQIDLAARDLVALDNNDPSSMNCEQRARWEAQQQEKTSGEGQQIQQSVQSSAPASKVGESPGGFSAQDLLTQMTDETCTVNLKQPAGCETGQECEPENKSPNSPAAATERPKSSEASDDN
ncbi:MAG: twin-arginine translocase TatA/TatE family subunit [Deltaproteobacteria bacterium]|nr:twin-arginine translocase TatA/TatE family subunit [Deltaproteobacteria bacterium]